MTLLSFLWGGLLVSDVDEIKVAVSYASVQSGVASLIPVLHGVVTLMSTLSLRLFHGPFFAQDARPTH